MHWSDIFKKPRNLFALVFLPAALFASVGEYMPGRLIVCFKSAGAPVPGVLSSSSFHQLSSDWKKALSSVRVKNLRPIIPSISRSQPAVLRTNARYQNYLAQLERTVVLTLEDDVDVNEAALLLNREPAVLYATPDHRLRLSRTPNDSTYAQQWALNNTGQAGNTDAFDPPTGTPGRDIDAERAWDTQTGLSSVVVAVIDTGVDWNHPDIAANVWSNADESVDGTDNDGNGFVDDVRGWDFGLSDNNPDDDCAIQDERGHGTHVAGIAGAVGNNATGITGIGWGIQLMPLKVASAACTLAVSAVMSALNYAVANGAKIVNMSLGSPTDNAGLRTAVAAADAAGVLMVAAAGNDGVTTQLYPAAYSEVIAVAATDRNDQKADFSNYGSWITLSAPGVGIFSTYPTIDGSYEEISGTSMASPMAAGVAALVYSQYPTLTTSQARARLVNSCESIDSLNPSFSGLLGAGRISAVRALLSLSSVSPNNGAISTTVNLALTGVAFIPGMTVILSKSGETSISATGVVQNSNTSLSCSVDLTGATQGLWTVTVSTGQTSQSLSDAFTVELIALTSVSPEKAANTGSVMLSLTGRQFENGISANLRLAGQSDIPGTNLIVFSATSATADFDIDGAQGGRWDVVVTKNSGSVTLSEGFVVTSSQFQIDTPSLVSDTVFTLSPLQGTQSVAWPAGATASSIELELSAESTLPSVDATKDPYSATGIGIEITAAPALTLQKPFDLTLSYRLVDLPSPDDEASLTLATYNSTTGRWEPLPSSLDTNTQTVRASPEHLSFFTLLQHAPSVDLERVVAFPNPFRADRGHSRIVFDFLTAGSRVRLYDIAGALIRDLVDDNEDGQIQWPVTNESGEPIASGIYWYLATDRNGNEKTGRVGIIR